MSKYKAIITTAGAAKIAAASAGGTQLKIVHMAVGDGNGTLPTPNPAQTKLVNEKYRAALNGLTIDKTLKNHILAEMIIPANVGGFWLREMGLYDEAGTLIAVSNMAESYKPKLEEGSGRTQTLRMILIVSSTEAVQVIAGGDTVLATKDFVADAIAAHEKTRNHPDASTTAKGLVQLSSATTSADETKASTPKALKTVSDASLKKDANLSDLPNKAAARGNLALGDAATKNVGVEGGQLMAVGAFGLGAGGVEYSFTNDTDLMDALKKRGSHFFRNTKDGTSMPSWAPGLCIRAGDANSMIAINPFSGNVIAAGFTDANTTAPKVNVLYGTANKPTAADVGALTDAQAAQKYALRSIKVNGKPISSDVNLLAGDVNAWNKTEADGRYVKRAGDTMSNTLNLPRLAFPSESAPPVNADDDLMRPNGFTLEQLAAQSKGYPLNEALGNLLTFKLNRYRNVQFAIGSGNTDFYLRSMRDDNPETAKKWARVYTTDFKPTLTDVKAADHRNNFAARMGIQRVLNGADMPTSAGVWSVENSSWTPVPWGSLYVTTNQSTLTTEPGNQRFIHYLFIGHGNGNKLYAATNNNGSFSGWSQYYSTAGKPTAADVGALTDAQAAQKYALRSIKVNGKPLSADVNLLAGDVNAWNKTEADGRYVKQAGDKMTGQLIASSFASTPEAMPNGAGAYVDQLSTQASFFQPNWQWPVNNGGIYVPVAKGTSTRKNQGYPTAVSFGYMMPANSEHAHPTIHAKGDSNVDCAWDFNPYTGKISSKAGTFVTDNWCPFPVGYVMLMGNVSDPNALYPGTKWQDLNGTGYDGRVISLGYDVMGIGGSNQVTIGAHNLPDHSHRGGMRGPGAEYGSTISGTDNDGRHTLNITTGTYTNGNGNEFVRNEPINVTNAYVHVRGWMRVA